jgi:hypothetical protein
VKLVRRFLTAAGLAALLLATAASAAIAEQPLETSIQEPAVFGSAGTSSLALTRIARADATWVKLDISWKDIAPRGSVKPSGFDAADPASSRYSWKSLDAIVRRAAARGLKSFLTISEAPEWAERPAGGRAGTNNPDPAELARFAQAVAVRYSGTFDGLPRVTAFEVWNEVNASFFFQPQRDAAKTDVSPGLYRQMVNQVATAIHAVRADNLVVAGALFPFTADSPHVQAIAPLRFMRELFCLDSRLHPAGSCPPVQLDVWSHHPYTTGSPEHHAASADNVSIRELPKMQTILRAAVAQHRIVSSTPVSFWVTEYGWDSNPPDPKGVPIRLLARWVSDSLFRMWSAGVTLASWFRLRDAGSEPYRSGFYFRCDQGIGCDRAKLTLDAFRFPFVAFRSRGRIFVWGRIPDKRQIKVLVERYYEGAWAQVKALTTDRYGIFSAIVRSRSKRGSFRARLGDGDMSIPFSLKRPRDFPINPPVG